jgi:hypothetical protein
LLVIAVAVATRLVDLRKAWEQAAPSSATSAVTVVSNRAFMAILEETEQERSPIGGDARVGGIRPKPYGPFGRLVDG